MGDHKEKPEVVLRVFPIILSGKYS